METEGGGCLPPLTRCTGPPAPPPASPRPARASSPRGWTARPHNTPQVRQNTVIQYRVQLLSRWLHSLLNVHVHCLCHSCSSHSVWSIRIWHGTMSVAAVSGHGMMCVFRSEPAYSTQSRSPCQEHFIVDSPCLPREREDLSGQWPARARYELFIVMRRTESEITFIFQHFSLQSHLSNRRGPSSYCSSQDWQCGTFCPQGIWKCFWAHS